MLDHLLEKWLVVWETHGGPEGWYAVVNDDGIVAYFSNEKDACDFRLMKINMELNFEMNA